MVGVRGRTNYPLTINIDDLGEDLRLTALADSVLGAERMTTYLNTALERLAAALQDAPYAPMHTLQILPAREREQLLLGVNSPLAQFPKHH